MAEKSSSWLKFKKFLKRNMTPTWAKHFAYQVVSFIISVALVIGVASYAITKSYEERTLRFVNGFTITAHTGSFDTAPNSLEGMQVILNNNVDIIEFDVRQRPDKTLVMAHDLIVTNSDGVELTEVFALLAQSKDVKINLDIKEIRVLDDLYKLLAEYGLYERAFLTGIEQNQVKAVKESACSDMEYYLNYKPSRLSIFSDDYQAKLVDILEETGAVGINCHYSHAGGQLSEFLHSKGYKLSVWTVDDKRSMKRMLVIKPDNITTKEHDMLLEIINNWEKKA